MGRPTRQLLVICLLGVIFLGGGVLPWAPGCDRSEKPDEAPSGRRKTDEAAPPPPPAKGDLAQVQGMMEWMVEATRRRGEAPVAVGRLKLRELVRALVDGCVGATGNTRHVLIRSLRQLGPAARGPLIALLSAPEYYLRRTAAEVLGELGEPSAVEALIRALFDKADVSDAAAAALDKIDPNWRKLAAAGRIVPALIAVLADGELHKDLQGAYVAEIRRQKAYLLRSPEEFLRRRQLWNEFRDPLRHLGRDDELPTRRGELARTLATHTETLPLWTASASALGHVRDGRGVQPLVRAVPRCLAAGKLLPGLADEALTAVCKALKKIEPAWCRSATGKAAVDGLLATFRTGDANAQVLAASALGRCGDGRALQPLLVAFQKEKHQERGYDYTSWIPGIVDGYWLGDLRGVGRIALALVRLGDRRAVQPLIELMRRKQEPRLEAALILGKIGGEQAVAPLAEMLADPRKQMRLAAAVGLSLTQSPSAVAPLKKLVADGLERETKEVEAAFDRLPEDKLQWLIRKYGSRRRAVREALREGLRGRTDVYVAAVWALGRLGGEAAAKALIELARAHPRSGVRRMAVYGLGRRADAAAVEALISALQDVDGNVRAPAIKMLGRAKDPRAVEPLIALLKDTDRPEERERYRSTTQPWWALPEPWKRHSSPWWEEDESWDPASRPRRPRSRRPEPASRPRRPTSRPWRSTSRPIPTPSTRPSRAASRPSRARAVRAERWDHGLGWRPPRRRRKKYELEFAAEALGAIGDKRAVGPLIVALAHDVRSAFPALARIDPSWPRSRAAREVVPDLIAMLAADTNETTRPTLILLTMIGDRRAAPALLEKMGRSGLWRDLAKALARIDPAWRTSNLALRQAPRLIGQLPATAPPGREVLYGPAGRQWERIALRRVEAAFFLGEIGDRRAVQPLIECFQAYAKQLAPDRRRDVFGAPAGGMADVTCSACAEALGKLADPRAVEPLVAVFKAIRVDAELGPWRGREGPHVPDHAVEAAWALGKLGDKRAVEPLLRVLEIPPRRREDRDRFGMGRYRRSLASIESAVVQALAELADPRALDALIEALRRVDLRPTVAPALAKWGDRKAVKPLIATLREAVTSVSPEVIQALDKLDANWRRSPAAREALAGLWGQFLDRASPLRESVVQFVTEPFLRRDTKGGREYEEVEPAKLPPAIQAIEQIDPDWRRSQRAREVRSRLHERLKQDAPPDESAAVVGLLCYLPDKESIAPLLPLLAEPDSQWMALICLDTIDPEWPKGRAARDFVPRLAEALRRRGLGEFSPSRWRAHGTETLQTARVLGRIATPAAVEALLDELRRNAERKAAHRPKGRPPNPWDRTDEEYGTRLEYAGELIKIAAGVLSAKDVEALLAELRDPKSALLDEVVLLAEHAPGRIDARPVAAAMSHSNPALRAAARRAFVFWAKHKEDIAGWGDAKDLIPIVPALIESLKYKHFGGAQVDAEAMASAARVLAALGDRRAVPPLITMLRGGLLRATSTARIPPDVEDPNERAYRRMQHRATHMSIAAAAARALGRLGDPRAVEPLIETLGDLLGRSKQALDTLRLPDSRGRRGRLTDLERFRLATNLRVLEAVSEAIGRLGDPRAIKPLKEFLKATDFSYYPNIAAAAGRTAQWALERLERK